MDKSDEDKVHEVNSKVKVSDIFEERIGKIFNACTPVFILLILLNLCTYYLNDLVIDIRATELHNESEEEEKEDIKVDMSTCEKLDMGTCEVSESGSEVLGKTGCVVYNGLYI